MASLGRAVLSVPSLSERVLPLRICTEASWVRMERWCTRSAPSLIHGLPTPAVFTPALSFRAASTTGFLAAAAGPATSQSSSSSGGAALPSLWQSSHSPPRAGAGSAGPLRAAAGAQELQPVEELPERLQKIVKSFQAVPDPRARYQQLLFYAAKLPPLPKDLQTPDFKVVGCVSQVWVVPQLDPEDGCIYFRADSDSQLTKGLAALLVEGLSGSRPEAILRITPGFITQLGLRQSLTPSRNNGFLNMLRLMQKHALSLAGEAPSGETAPASAPAPSPAPSAPAAPPASPPPSPLRSGAAPAAAQGAGPAGSRAMCASAGVGGTATRADVIREKLAALLSPAKLEVEDVSHQHAGHAGAREALAMAAASGKASHAGETHFNVTVVSEAFEGLSMVKRHRMIYQALDQEFKDGLHALSLTTKSVQESS